MKNQQDKVIIKEKTPPISIYQKFRRIVNWSTVSDHAVKQSFQNQIYSVCLCNAENDILGFGRLVGDHGIYYYLQDIIVLPEYQGKGYGKEIVEKLLDYIKNNADPTAFIGLMAAKGYAAFYEKFGFKIRGSDSPGMYMYTKELNKGPDNEKCTDSINRH